MSFSKNIYKLKLSLLKETAKNHLSKHKLIPLRNDMLYQKTFVLIFPKKLRAKKKE